MTVCPVLRLLVVTAAPNRKSALKPTKRCVFVATLVCDGGFALDWVSYPLPTQKYTENTIACMLTFVRVVCTPGRCKGAFCR